MRDKLAGQSELVAVDPPDCLLSYHLQRALKDYMEEFKLPQCEGNSLLVVKALAKRIENRAPISVSDISKDLNISTQTLHKRLINEGCAYQHLFDQVKRHFALYLLVSQMPIPKIAHVLQYDNKQSFEVSFIRWTGLDPQSFIRLFMKHKIYR
ncbi:MAG: hypothetical protein K6L80_14615 [Agarilytica sp.]